MKLHYFAVVLLLVLLPAKSFSDSKLRRCHEIDCPTTAVSCTTEFAASPDNKKLITKFTCDGENGEVMEQKVKEEVNKYPNKVYQPKKVVSPFLVI